MSIIADWNFKEEIEENILKDSSGNNNDLEIKKYGDCESLEKYIRKEASGIRLENKISSGCGVYFKTKKTAMMNSLDFSKGYTIEAILELPKKYDAWMGILTREGMGKNIGKVEGEVEIMATLAYNEAFQWTNYTKNLKDNPTNWSINATNEKVREGEHHLVVVNDGKHTLMYLDGIKDIRNPLCESIGIEREEGLGWVVGAGLWDNKITSLFSGKLNRIRIADRPLKKEKWLVKDIEETFKLKGNNKEERMLSSEKNYNFIVIPDSQYMGQARPEMVHSITKWIGRNKEKLNIDMVLHVGDITEESERKEFINADKHFKELDLEKVNYMTTPGNHDYKDGGEKYSEYFGEARYRKQKGFFKDSFCGRHMYSIKRSGSYEYLFISIDYKDLEEGIKFAKNILKENRKKPAIIFTHDAYTKYDNKFIRTKNGEKLWTNLVNEEMDIFMVIAGHEFAIGHRKVKNRFGKEVVEMLVNYQDYPSGGNGWIRLLEIDEENGIKGRTFSPWIETIDESERTKYDLLNLTSEDDRFFISLNLKERFS